MAFRLSIWQETCSLFYLAKSEQIILGFSAMHPSRGRRARDQMVLKVWTKDERRMNVWRNTKSQDSRRKGWEGVSPNEMLNPEGRTKGKKILWKKGQLREEDPTNEALNHEIPTGHNQEESFKLSVCRFFFSSKKKSRIVA